MTYLKECIDKVGNRVKVMFMASFTFLDLNISNIFHKSWVNQYEHDTYFVWSLALCWASPFLDFEIFPQWKQEYEFSRCFASMWFHTVPYVPSFPQTWQILALPKVVPGFLLDITLFSLNFIMDITFLSWCYLHLQKCSVAVATQHQ